MTGPAPEISSEVLAQRKELVDVYIAAQRRLEKVLTSALLTDFRRFRIQEQLVQIDAIIAALNRDVKDALPGVVKAYYTHGTDLASAALKAQAVSVTALNLGNRIHTAAVQAVAEQMAQDLAKANMAMRDTSTRILRRTQQVLVEERQINQIIAGGVATGESRRQTSARLRDALAKEIGAGNFVEAGGRRFSPEYYAELVTRTRTREAVTQGAVTRSMEFGITLFQVSIHDNPCPKCAQYQGKVYSILPDSGFPMLEARPPFHPHCVLGETPVFAPGQRAASVASYDGPIVDLRLSNSAFVSVTPNHMFLTPAGFAFAKDLREGDDVLCSTLFEEVVLRNPDNNNRPPAIADVVKTLAGSRGMTTTGVPVSPEYLHGDARFMSGDIDIVRPDGLLGSGSEAEIAEQLRHLDFSRADVGLFGLNGCRDTASMLQGLALSANCLVGLSREQQAALWPYFRHAESHRLTAGALLNSAFSQDAINYDLSTSVGGNQFADALPCVVSGTDLVSGEYRSGPRAFFDSPGIKSASETPETNTELAANIGNRSPGKVSVASVVFKGLRDYSGHVYDLQTSSSLYVCNGLISSNCRHVLVGYVERPNKPERNAAIRELSNRKEPLTGGLPGYKEAVAQARKTGGLIRKKLPGEPRTVTPPVRTGPTGEDVRKRIKEVFDGTGGSLTSVRQEISKLYPGNPTAARMAAPLTFKATGSMTKAKAEEKFTQGMNEFFSMVSEKSLPQSSLKPAFHSQLRRRAFYSLEREEVNLAHENEQRIIIHEMGHWLEHKNPRIALAANAFLEERTKGEAIQTLRKLTGNRGYRSDEVAKKDKFKDPYIGKIYRKFTDRELQRFGYPSGAVLRCTEIVSMGLESMHVNPQKFAEEDPEYFDFIWDVIMSGEEYP